MHQLLGCQWRCKTIRCNTMALQHDGAATKFAARLALQHNSHHVTHVQLAGKPEAAKTNKRAQGCAALEMQQCTLNIWWAR